MWNVLPCSGCSINTNCYQTSERALHRDPGDTPACQALSPVAVCSSFQLAEKTRSFSL